MEIKLRVWYVRLEKKADKQIQYLKLVAIKNTNEWEISNLDVCLSTNYCRVTVLSFQMFEGMQNMSSQY